MADIEDQDSFFSGQHQSSTPRSLLGEGVVSRLLNCRFIKGAITNAIAFDEFKVSYYGGPSARVYASGITYQNILDKGDVQLLAPLETFTSKSLVAVISDIIFLIDVDSGIARDITPVGFSTDPDSAYPLSYLDNDSGVYGSGSYLTIFNWPNRPIFINADEARFSKESSFEMPPSRVGATAGLRSFVVSGFNTMYAGDPFGGASPLGPLNFQETLDSGGSYFGQTFTMGSILSNEEVTAVCRLPKFLGPSQDFIAQSILVSTRNHKYIIAGSAPRASWDNGIQFITYGGSGEGISGPLACTNLGDNVVYTSLSGRIKNLAQDQEKDTSMRETFFDEPLGQYLSENESSFHFRDWYKTLDHSRSIIKYNKERLFASVYPVLSPSIDKYGAKKYTYSHRALAVASVDSGTLVGATAQIAWEGFYNSINPVGMVTLADDLYVVSKGQYGDVRFLKRNDQRDSSAKSVIYTRGYFSTIGGRRKSVNKAVLYFRELSGPVDITVSALVNDRWKQIGKKAKSNSKIVKLTTFDKCVTDSFSVPLKIDIDHNGERFALESVRVDGETYRDEK